MPAAVVAADQGIHAVLRQKARQRAVAAAVGVDHFCADDRVFCHFIGLELLGMTECWKIIPFS